MAALTAGPAQAQEKAKAAAPATPPSAGLFNDYLRGQSDAFKAWDIGGQVRGRFESRQYYGSTAAGDFRRIGGTSNPDNGVLNTRVLLHLGYTPVSWLNFYVEGRDASSNGDDRPGNPDRDMTDLHQAYVKIGDGKGCPWTIKLGRQELVYGDERLIGASDWTNTKRSFDAAKIRFENQDIWVDAFVSRVVLARDNVFNNDNTYDTFSGIYASTKTLIPKQETQLYVLARNVEANSTRVTPPGASSRDVYTVGTRMKSLPGAYGGWDYGLEAAGQFGRWRETSGPATGTNLSQEAFAGALWGGYTFKDAFGTPRIGLEYDYSSGDDNAADKTHGTFDNLFPTNHKFYGAMDLLSWQNLHDVKIATQLNPCKGVTMNLDYHSFWLASTSDNFYTVGGARRGAAAPSGVGYGANSTKGSYLGSELDLVVTYAIKPYAVLGMGVGHFFTGQYIDNTFSAVGGAKDANWAYVQMTFSF